ncbi:hypothetical protein [Cohnella rhizosphaerae]|uniref:Uncharacterized protein n=1 Tax=Cohnella rhizosphaerae TaxID=1457232 RepID=A0A9X4KXV3_9BACL|nr:hypothetical protein [Cohnella rhizosphaerae]MDG0812748.1 hypothetical protein [Cohnella rhizosphaerae]
MKTTYTGLAVLPTTPASMNVIVEPGRIMTGSRVVELAEAATVCIRVAGQRRFNDQRYRIVGEGAASPSGWNGENIRGTAGMPYQRMVPGSLQVYARDRSKRYVPEADYTQDSYWGSIKRNPQGGIAIDEELSIDYAVWLCRYDAIVLLEDGTISVVEGDCDAPESRELLLPEPPKVERGVCPGPYIHGLGADLRLWRRKRDRRGSLDGRAFDGWTAGTRGQIRRYGRTHLRRRGTSCGAR